MAHSNTGELLGRIFDRRYRVNELIGSGGMGSVYRATHLEMNREVALKVLERGIADTDKQVQRFYQEARASSRLQHPNTIRVFDFGRAEDARLYLAMEYLRGETLTDLLRRTPRPELTRVCRMMRQVCKSLAEAHQVGIIHRDLKPDNIFITDIFGESDFIKVLDFGIAKSTEGEEQESLTQTGFICGTPRYLSPEQAMGKAIDARSDLYSLGVILYEMLSGGPPFTAATPIALVMKHIHEKPPQLPDDGTDRVRWLSYLVWSLMQKSPKRRPASSAVVSDAMEAIMMGVEPTGITRPPGATPPQASRPDASRRPPSAARRRPTMGSGPAVRPRARSASVSASAHSEAPPNSTVMLDSSDVMALDARSPARPIRPADSEVILLEPDDDEGNEPTRMGVAAMPAEPVPTPGPRRAASVRPAPVPSRSASVRPASGPRRSPSRAHIRRAPSAPAEDQATRLSVAAMPDDESDKTRVRMSAMPGPSPGPPGVVVDMDPTRTEGPRRGPSAVGLQRRRPPSAIINRSRIDAARGEEAAHPMTRVMASPLAAGAVEEKLPIGDVGGVPTWTWFVVAAVVVAALVGGFFVWRAVSTPGTDAVASDDAASDEAPASPGEADDDGDEAAAGEAVAEDVDESEEESEDAREATAGAPAAPPEESPEAEAPAPEPVAQAEAASPEVTPGAQAAPPEPVEPETQAAAEPAVPQAGTDAEAGVEVPAAAVAQPAEAPAPEVPEAGAKPPEGGAQAATTEPAEGGPSAGAEPSEEGPPAPAEATEPPPEKPAAAPATRSNTRGQRTSRRPPRTKRPRPKSGTRRPPRPKQQGGGGFELF